MKFVQSNNSGSNLVATALSCELRDLVTARFFSYKIWTKSVTFFKKI